MKNGRLSKSAITKVQAAIIAVVIVAAVIAGVAYYHLMSPTAPEYIKIGWPVPLTG